MLNEINFDVIEKGFNSKETHSMNHAERGRRKNLTKKSMRGFGRGLGMRFGRMEIVTKRKRGRRKERQNLDLNKMK